VPKTSKIREKILLELKHVFRKWNFFLLHGSRTWRIVEASSGVAKGLGLTIIGSSSGMLV
jgi:hypothetical protein